MKNSRQQTFTLRVKKEDKFYVGTVLENNVSSYGKTEDEALHMTIEALQGYLEVQFEMEQEKMTKELTEMVENIKKVSNNQYSLSLPNYASSFQMYGNSSNSRKTMMVA